ncbi:M20 metallopeptidase family protein [Clostridium cellulovorans]|uniref:Amidohydrolase n=1 Tax=Clostridium cellulovorans (strain ATCC 35296 / DSM 3052 / OCM 3 / 743B) TaxID=573061 RepID=D9SX12_CLOC7|nr:amidohydrolase [Clostridium cellulovorans]ADL51373.1 amidohydrolase [Clostridium cellulovorans 743B]
MEFLKEALAIKDELIAARRDFHMYPELDFDLPRTSKKICEFLEKEGIEYFTVAKCGVVATIKGQLGEGKTIAVRADMDALPLEDRKQCNYKSTADSKMHACGHDAHTTIALGVAKVMNKNKDKFKGNVKILFEPAEETSGGATLMIEEGALENPTVDSVIGLHVAEDIPCGKAGIIYDIFNAASNPFTITIKGKGGHGAHPDSAVDPIVIAANVINALQTIVSREITPTDATVITIGFISGGTAQNIIPEEVKIGGIIRTIKPEHRELVTRRVPEITEGIVKAMRGTCEIKISEGYPCLINDNATVDLIKDAAEKVVGVENVIKLKAPSMGVESFAYFSNAKPSAFYVLGTRNEEKGIVHPAHGSLFDVDEDALPIGVAIQCTAAFEFLKG